MACAEQPLLSVIVQVYVVVVLGLTVILCVVLPSAHKKPTPPVACNTVLVPRQIRATPRIDTVGVGLT